MATDVLLDGVFCLNSLRSFYVYARLLLWSLLLWEEGRRGEICEELESSTLSMEDGMAAYSWATF